MKTVRFAALAALVCSTALFGIGCLGAGNTPSGPVDGQAAIEAAEGIQFIAGDTFDIRQAPFGFGAFSPELLAGEDGVRTVTIRRFAPMHVAELEWELVTTRETESSKRLRSAYEEEARKNPATSAPAPTRATERVTTRGELLGINLRTPHTAFFPLYWPERRHDLLGEKSGLWLSDDAFLELVKTRRTILNYGVFDDALDAARNNVPGLREALASLRRDAAEEGGRRDLTELAAEAEFIEWPLEVNGRPTVVSAIRARNWFGEIVVLNNRQNPLILKLSLASEEGGDDTAILDELFGYEIKTVYLSYRP